MSEKSTKTAPRGHNNREYQFCARHGANAVLSSDMRTAQRRESLLVDNCVIVSSTPMVPNIAYRVQVQKIDERFHPEQLWLGATEESPYTINLTVKPTDLHRTVIVSPQFVHYTEFGKKHVAVSLPISGLTRVREMDTIGVLLDYCNFVHLVINDVDKGIVCPYPPNLLVPTYAVFDVSRRLLEVRTVTPGEIPIYKTR